MILGFPTILIPGLQLQAKNGNDSLQHSGIILTDDDISWVGSINLLCVPLGSLLSGILELNQYDNKLLINFIKNHTF